MMKPGLTVANTRAVSRMSSGRTQQISAAFSGVHSCTAARSSSKPTVQLSTNWWS